MNEKTIQNSAKYFTTGVIVIAAAGLVSYFPGLEIIGKWHPEYVPMAPTTAVSFAALCLALYLWDHRISKHSLFLVSIGVIVVAVGLFGALELTGYLVDADFTFEDKYIPHWGYIHGIPVARMSPITGAMFFLSASAILICLASHTKLKSNFHYGGFLTGILSGLIMLASFTIVLGYFYGTPLMYDQPIIPMAFTTALAFLSLSLSIVLTNGPRYFPLNQLSGDSVRSELIRKFTPFVFAVVIFQGVVTHYTMIRTNSEEPIILSILAIIISVFSALIIFKISKNIERRIQTVNSMREKREVELKQEKEKYYSLFNSIRDAILVAGLDRKIVDCNPAFEDLFGYSKDQIKGKQTLTLYENENEFTALGKRLKDNVGNEDFLYAVRYKKKSGEIFPGETNVFFLKDADGVITGFIGLIRDISRRVEGDEKIRKNEQLFSSLVDNLFDAVIVVNQNGTIQYANKSSEILFNREKEALVGKPFGFPVTICEPFEMDIHQSDGTVRYAEMQASQLEWKGELSNLCSIRDNTEKKLAQKERGQMNEHLVQLQKNEAIGTLAGGIAHDFNNLLSPIIGFTELAKDRLKDDPVAEEHLDQVYQAGNRAKELVKQILSFSRQTESEFQPLLLTPIVKEVLKMLRSTIPTTIEIHQQIESERVVFADAIGVHQILMNLCTNAKHAMEDTGGVLSVSLKDVELPTETFIEDPNFQAGPYVRLRVKDNGCGMEKSIKEKIFEPYFTTKEMERGTGLGLAVVHGIVNHHKGLICVESALGKGTVFEVYLPCSEQKLKEIQHEKIKVIAGDEHILFVDDELPMVKLNRQILENLGYRVTTRTSSIEALELFKNKPNSFDLMLTDMTMPNMTGDTLAAKCLHIRPDLPVILATGFSEKLDEKKAKQMGIAAMVYKPLSKADLANAVRKVLDMNKASGAEKR